MSKIQDNTTEETYQVLVVKDNKPILDIYKSISAGEIVDFGKFRDRQPDRDWGQIQGTNLEVSPPKKVNITPELRQILLEDLAYAYGSNTSIFSEKLKEFGFVTPQ